MTTDPSILQRIIDHKRKELADSQATTPLGAIQQQLACVPPVRDFAAALCNPSTVALIAEVKKASPSRGVLIDAFDHTAIAHTYMTHGASALSVLTDVAFFQGSLTYLQDIRHMQQSPPLAGTSAEHIPLLRKDFIIDPYQVYEARAYGADALLLIVAVLDDATLRDLLSLTHALGMHALVEVHTADEMVRALDVGAKIIGVNNRNLHTFTTDLHTTETLATLLPTGLDRPILVSESGIHTAEDVRRLHGVGVNAMLVGEALVTSGDIGTRVRELVQL
jgi:indole-3-glycerol phosphate synthase